MLLMNYVEASDSLPCCTLQHCIQHSCHFCQNTLVPQYIAILFPLSICFKAYLSNPFIDDVYDDSY